jgi:hypothetical protein
LRIVSGRSTTSSPFSANVEPCPSNPRASRTREDGSGMTTQSRPISNVLTRSWPRLMTCRLTHSHMSHAPYDRRARAYGGGAARGEPSNWMKHEYMCSVVAGIVIDKVARRPKRDSVPSASVATRRTGGGIKVPSKRTEWPTFTKRRLLAIPSLGASASSPAQTDPLPPDSGYGRGRPGSRLDG